MRKAVLWAWITAAVLGAAGPVLSVVAKGQVNARLPIYAAVAVMLASMLFLPRRTGRLSLAISTSASGVALGGSVGFFALAILFDRPNGYLFGVKWLAAGFLLTLILRRDLKNAEEVVELSDPAVDEAEIARLNALSPEEREAEFRRLMADTDRLFEEVEALQKQSGRRILSGLLILLLGAALWFSSLALSNLRR